MGAYDLHLAGRVELRDPGGVAVPLRTRKTALVLAMLAMEGPSRRDELALAVWPDVPLASAREGLRSALCQLRRALPPGAIIGVGERIRLREGVVRVVFEGDGEFMPGFESDWAIERRLERRAAWVAEALEAARRSGSPDEALAHAERACARDPLDEEAAMFRERLLRETGRKAEAAVRSDAFRARAVRELGVVPSLPEEPLSESPVRQMVEWLLLREPESACGLLAATREAWLAGSLEEALAVHQRVLAMSSRRGADRRMVESGAALFEAMIDPSTVQTGRLEAMLQEARKEGEAASASVLCEALAYGSLSKGAFAQAVGFAKAGQADARRRGDLSQEGTWGLHLGIVEFHAGDRDAGFGHIDRAVERLASSGSTLAVLNAQNAQLGFWVYRGRADLVAERLPAQRRRIQAYGSARMMAWSYEIEARMHEAMGDLPRAYAAYRAFRGMSEAAGQCAVAMADDGLMRVGCALGEFDDAAAALARNAVYRRRKGSVPSVFERESNRPAARRIRERIGERGMRAAFLRAAAA